ncbi:rRNA methyltransferase 3, mitochondrial [Scaptodrosophila lebanonensis]|uniref:rRNA methyltransferase 3, mitochondrial n=1 Tax=Drosophila lebanonensis TaxID=7225 RepID=A0A6J2UIN7_DROLE|nr:rRNA methyltransferase 3, mitochondrial [Scaptodrosophila lebanonensis]
MLVRFVALSRCFHLHIKHVSNNNNILRLSSSASIDQRDIKDALDIEANLFENSTVKHQPVLKHDALRKHKPITNKQQKPQYVATVAAKRTQKAARLPSPLIKDTDLDLEFARLTLQDPMLSTLLTTVRSRKRRDKKRQIIIEGTRLIREAFMCGLHMHALLFSQKEHLTQLQEEIRQSQREHKAKIYKVPQHDLKTWSSLMTPPGLLAIFERPSAHGLEQTLQKNGSAPLPIMVVCDNIREPNNLGSIIRTCAALPVSQVVVTHGCCDPWESKALRGGCGGQFRLPIRDDVMWDQLALTIPPEDADDCHVIIAENNLDKLGNKQSVLDYTNMGHLGAYNILIIGGESHGVSEDAYKFMNSVGTKGRCVYIPLAAGIDSLNVASALTLILFELRRKLVSPI